MWLLTLSDLGQCLGDPLFKEWIVKVVAIQVLPKDITFD